MLGHPDNYRESYTGIMLNSLLERTSEENILIKAVFWEGKGNGNCLMQKF